MTNEMSLDLRVARRKAGLTQSDCAHLLGLNKAQISKIESGERAIRLEELCLLSVIYDLPIDGMATPVRLVAEAHLRERLASLRPPSVRWIGTFNRQHTLSSLAERLESDSPQKHDR